MSYGPKPAQNVSNCPKSNKFVRFVGVRVRPGPPPRQLSTTGRFGPTGPARWGARLLSYTGLADTTRRGAAASAPAAAASARGRAGSARGRARGARGRGGARGTAVASSSTDEQSEEEGSGLEGDDTL